MPNSLVLEPAAEADIAASGPLTLFRITGPRPRLALLGPAAAHISLAPGAYTISLGVQTESVAAPRLLCRSAEGVERVVTLSSDDGARWRSEFVLSATTTSLALALDGAEGAVLVSDGHLETGETTRAPNLREAALEFARALYRKTPRTLRVALGQAVARRRARARMSNAARASDEAREAGEIRIAGPNNGELEIRRADFDARFAIARNIREAIARVPVEPTNHGARLVAFYLPQYHAIPENDAWWGKGFTEWSNVAKATPQFLGHHQPRLPGELGFYDLTAPAALANQIALARAHGVSAFCFHYYWFAGKRLLEKPLDAFVANAALDIDFTLCWANENWTRRWDGADDEVLIAQEHSPADHARVFDDLARYLEDPRALRIGGAPLILVYRPAIISDARAMTDIWRERALARGWPGIFIAATDAFLFDDPCALGFDALVEFPPHGLAPNPIGDGLAWLNANHRGVVFDYQETAHEAIRRLRRRAAKDFAHFPGVMPSWDNEARRPGAGAIYHGATPKAYADWLAAACASVARFLPADRRLVFVNAWNEWAEGAYLEPDLKWGRAFLEATAAVMKSRAP